MTNFNSDIVVDVKYLIEAREKENVVVLDARGEMLQEDSFLYDKATVVDWTDISVLGEFGGEQLGKLLSKENYTDIFKILNINAETEVLVYGFTMPKAGFGDEGRVVYTFDYVGHKNVKIVDGGFDAIEKYNFNKKYKKAEDRIDVSSIIREEGKNNKAAIFTEELLSYIGKKNVKILDTRLSIEYNGRVVYGENKAGHVVGAKSLPFNSLVDKNGYLKSKEEIQKKVADLGITKDDLIITYCTTGVRASYVAVMLKQLGYNVRNYEPSFARYANVGEVVLPQYTFRKAKKDDKLVIEGLLEFIYSLELAITKKVGKEKIATVVTHCFNSEEDRFSYKNCHVVEKLGEIVGFLFSYDYDFVACSKKYWYEIVSPQYELPSGSIIFDYDEVLPGEYYLDTLYTFENYRGQGVGKVLLDNFVELSSLKQSLNVAQDNYGARKLYESYGFKKETEILIDGHPYDHLVREK